MQYEKNNVKNEDIMKKIMKSIAIVAIVGLFLGTIIFLVISSKDKPTIYEVITPAKDTITLTTVATGSIKPRDEILIKPQISGIISEVYCKAGQMVKEGDILATVKIIPEMGQLNSAEANVKYAKISLDAITLTYNRTKNLYNRGVATLEEFEKAETDFRRAKEELVNAKNNLDIVEKGVLSSSTKLSNTQIRATIDGMVLSVPVKVGNSVILSNTFNDGTTIATIADLNDMLFVGNINETEIEKITEGMAAKVAIGAIKGATIDATVEYISPQGVDNSGIVSYPIEAAVVIPDTLFIRAGYSANAEFVTAKRENILTIPEKCLTFSGDSIYVERLMSTVDQIESQVFEKQVVELGISDGVNVEVIKGVSATDKLKGFKL